jgi:hypothetical protein
LKVGAQPGGFQPLPGDEFLFDKLMEQLEFSWKEFIGMLAVPAFGAAFLWLAWQILQRFLH